MRRRAEDIWGHSDQIFNGRSDLGFIDFVYFYASLGMIQVIVLGPVAEVPLMSEIGFPPIQGNSKVWP